MKRKQYRRTYFELITDLKQKRDRLRESLAARTAKLTAKIEALEEKYQKRIQIAELVRDHSPEQIAQQEQELRQKLIAFRAAQRIVGRVKNADQV